MDGRFHVAFLLSSFAALFVLPIVFRSDLVGVLCTILHRRRRKMIPIDKTNASEKNSGKGDTNDEVSFQGKGLKLDSETNAKEVVDAINNCKNMVTLCLEGNTVGVESAKAIAKALEGQPHFKRALWKDMFTGRLKTEIPQALNFLSGGIQLAGAQLTELDLSDNAFGPVGVEGIVCLLKSTSCFSLKELRLNNNGLGIMGGKLLATALGDSLKNSEHMPNRFGLKVLVCGRNRLEVDGAKALAAVFKNLGSLEEVSMPQNGITHDGIAALADAFAYNPRLRLINLNDNTFTERGAKAFAQNLPKMRELENINFGDCLIKNEGCLALAAVMKDALPKLKELNLGFNEIASDGGLAIVRALEGKPVQRIELNGNFFGPEGCGEIQETLEALGLTNALGSLSDDEEGAFEDSENEKDEDENRDDEDEDGEDEIIENQKELTNEKSIPVDSSQVVPVTFKEFLEDPTEQKFISLGKNRSSVVLAELSNNSTFDDVLQLFFKVVCVIENIDENARSAVFEVADAILQRGFKTAVETDSVFAFSNCFLVHLGLIKSEDKKFKPVNSLRGPFIALEHCVCQSYFVKETREILQFFLSIPNKAVNMNDKSVHLLKQALFRT